MWYLSLDQWSPLNPEGKRLYDRDFLLSVQYSSESTQKPAGLPDLPEIILDKVKKNSQNFIHNSYVWDESCTLCFNSTWMINSDLLEINVFFSPTAHNQIGHPFQVSTQILDGHHLILPQDLCEEDPLE